MTDIVSNDFTGNLFKLLTETFEGGPAEGGTAYLDKGSGLFPTLDRISSEIASKPPFAGGTSIAAHCAHIAYYVRVLHNFMTRQEQTVDWDESWRLERVDADGWEALTGELRQAYAQVRQTLESVEAWGDEEVGDSLAIVVHTAYHLGAVRQALRAIQAADDGLVPRAREAVEQYAQSGGDQRVSGGRRVSRGGELEAHDSVDG